MSIIRTNDQAKQSSRDVEFIVYCMLEALCIVYVQELVYLCGSFCTGVFFYFYFLFLFCKRFYCIVSCHMFRPTNVTEKEKADCIGRELNPGLPRGRREFYH